jgi:hypothetical protein
VIGVRFYFPESWSSTSGGKKTVAKTPKGYVCA